MLQGTFRAQTRLVPQQIVEVLKESRERFLRNLGFRHDRAHGRFHFLFHLGVNHRGNHGGLLAGSFLGHVVVITTLLLEHASAFLTGVGRHLGI